MNPKRSTRQGVYLIVAGPMLYVGSTAGGRSRSFSARLDEHLRELANGTHANDALARQYKIDGGKGWRMLQLARVPRGDIAGARFVESAIIRALRKVVCNERK